MKKIESILTEEEQALEQKTHPRFTKKERLMMTRELEKLEYSVGGIRNMSALPSLMFVVDVKREAIAVSEAKKLDIPVIALIDTNCDPNLVQYPIPANDDGTRSIRLLTSAVADAVLEGSAISEQARQAVKKSEVEQNKTELAIVCISVHWV